MGRQGELAAHAQVLGQGADEGLGLGGGMPVGLALLGQQSRVMPDRLVVGPPEAGQGPARELFARVPLTLADMQQAAGGEVPLQALDQLLRQALLGRTHGGGVPLVPVHVVDGDEGRLAAHGQAHIVFQQVLVHLVTEGLDGLPLVLGVGLGDPRVLVDARHLVVEVELHLALFHGAGDGGRADWVRGAGQRDVALAGEQPRGGVEPDPAGAGDIDLRPGMQVGEVRLRAARAVEGLLVRGQLHQIAGDEARRQAQVAQDLHQHPGRVAAGTQGLAQGLLAGLDAGLHADRIADVPLQALVERHQEVHGAGLAAVYLGQPGLEQRAVLLDLQVGAQLLGQLGVVLEGAKVRVLLQEEVEGVDGDQLGDHLHLNGQNRRLLRKDQSCQIVAEGVLLPVDEVVLRLDAQGVGQDRRAGMGRRAQPDHMGRQVHRTVEAVLGLVVDSDLDRHEVPVSRRRRIRV